MNNSSGYTDWITPSQTIAGGNENWLTLGRYGSNLYGWNDEGAAVGSIGGFIVEYDIRVLLHSAPWVATSTEACTTINGQTLTFPAGTFEPGDTIQFTAYQLNDPRIVTNLSDPLYGKCRNSPGPLTLFTDSAFAGAELRIPPYLCGSPKFVVVKVNSEDITILKGAVFRQERDDREGAAEQPLQVL